MDFKYVSKLVVLDFISKPQGNQVQLIYVLAHPFFRDVLCTRQQQLEKKTIVIVLDFFDRHFGNYIHTYIHITQHVRKLIVLDFLDQCVGDYSNDSINPTVV